MPAVHNLGEIVDRGLEFRQILIPVHADHERIVIPELNAGDGFAEGWPDWFDPRSRDVFCFQEARGQAGNYFFIALKIRYPV